MRPCILWVEDNASDVILVRQAFTEIGMDVDLIVAPNAVHAFKYMDSRAPYVMRRDPPDLILVDINLPGINGMVVLNELRLHKNWKTVPCVVLTSSRNPKELQACEGLGAVECITKPATFDGYLEVMKRLRNYLPGSGGYCTDSRTLKYLADQLAESKHQTNRDRSKSEVTNKVLDDLAKPKSDGSGLSTKPGSDQRPRAMGDA